MMNLLPKKSKKGITLVESVIAVVCLAILTIGIISLLSTGSAKIVTTGHESANMSEATEMLDFTISAISNGSLETTKSSTGGEIAAIVVLSDAEMNALLEEAVDDAFSRSVTVTSTISYHDPDMNINYRDESANVRGWYIKLTWNGVTVRGFASNTEGVFDV